MALDTKVNKGKKEQFPRTKALEEWDELARGAERYVAAPRTVICRQGAPGGKFYIILSGKVRAFRRGSVGVETDLSVPGAEGRRFSAAGCVSGLWSLPREAESPGAAGTGPRREHVHRVPLSGARRRCPAIRVRSSNPWPLDEVLSRCPCRGSCHLRDRQRLEACSPSAVRPVT